MNTMYEFTDSGFHYKIFDNGLWEKTKTKVKTPLVINNIKPLVDQLLAKVQELTLILKEL